VLARQGTSTAAASGCSLDRLEAPASRNIQNRQTRRRGDRDDRGLPSVSVPVLSTTKVVDFLHALSASPT